jgi:flagellar hook assembly protein FlgD
MNYPNPANPSTQITFDLPEEGNVSLTVHDILGREIAILSNRYHNAGYHKITWNGTNDLGVLVASGVYFARLEVIDRFGKVRFSGTIKCIVAR